MKDKVAVVVESLSVGVRGNAGGNGFCLADGFADDFVVVGVGFAVIRGMLLRWDFPHLAVKFHRGFKGQGHGVVGFAEVAGEDALEEATAVLQGNKDDVLLRAKSEDSHCDPNSCPPSFAVVDVL